MRPTDTEILDALERAAREEPLVLHAETTVRGGYRGLGLALGGESRSLRDAVVAAFLREGASRAAVDSEPVMPFEQRMSDWREVDRG